MSPELSSHVVVWALRHPREASDSGVEPDTQPRQRPDEPPVLACGRCRETITTESDRVEVAGAREHTFMNPHGFCFHIGCFAAARSLLGFGGWTDEWSWFPPCTWQVQQCAHCGEHLGWLFRSHERRFYGLVLDRLVRLGPEGPAAPH